MSQQNGLNRFLLLSKIYMNLWHITNSSPSALMKNLEENQKNLVQDLANGTNLEIESV